MSLLLSSDLVIMAHLNVSLAVFSRLFDLVQHGLLDLSLTLESGSSDQSLDLSGLVLLAVLTEDTTDGVLLDIISLLQGKKLSDFGGSLRSESALLGFTGKTLDIGITLLDDDEVHDGEIVSNDATTDRLSLSHTSTTFSVAGHTPLEKESNTAVLENTLLHREALLVVSTSDLHDVSLEFVTERIGWDFSSHSLLPERHKLMLIFDFEGLLETKLRVGDVNLCYLCHPFFPIRTITSLEIE